MISFDELGVVGVAKGVAEGVFSPTDVIEETFSRIDKGEEQIQAWSHIDKERALRDAEVLSEEAAAGRLRGPLHGVPFGVKDELLVEGMPTGMRGPGGPDAETSDATAVARLRAAGAIIVGKTHMPLDGVAPPTRNPWNFEHTAGGTSSGSGAAVGARMVPGAIAEQTAGSGIRPAMFCGVVGMKPSYGRIGRFGCLPFAWSLDHVSLIALTVADIALMLSVTSGPDPLDSTSLQEDPPPAVVAERETPPRLGLVRNFFYDTCIDEMVGGVEGATEKLADAGAKVDDVLLPESFGLTWPAHRLLMAGEKFLIQPGAPIPDEPVVSGTSGRVTLPTGTGALMPASVYIKARQVRRWLQSEIATCWDAHDALIMPVAPTPAPKGFNTGDASLLSPWSLLGFPAMSIPFGFTANGLPLGLQLVAPIGKDYQLLRTANWLEKVLGRLPEPALAIP